MPTTFYTVLDDDDEPIALFRRVIDDDAQTLDLEYLTADGTWKGDPSLVDEIHEDAVEVDASEVAGITALLVGSPSEEQDPQRTAALAAPPDPSQG